MTPRLARIRVFPIKSLDPLELDQAEISRAGHLAGDRDYALFDSGGRVLNAKRLGASIVSIRAEYSNGGRAVNLRTSANCAEFDLYRDRAAVEAWFARSLGQTVSLRMDERGGFPDDELASGPTVLGSASINTVAGWFGMPAEEVRRRFRANLEIEGLDPFEEDLLFGPPGIPRRFRIGDVEFLGTNPCMRCVVPTMDSVHGGASGPLTPKRFAALRERCRSSDSEIARYRGYYRLAVNTRLSPGQEGKLVRVGDELAGFPSPVRDGGRPGGAAID